MTDDVTGSTTMADATPEAPPDARARIAHEARLAALGRQVATLDQRRKTFAAERDDLIRSAVFNGLSHSQVAEIGHVYKANVGFIADRPAQHLVTFDADRLDRMGAEVKSLDLERRALIRQRNEAVVEAVRRYGMHYERIASLIGQTRANVGLIVASGGPSNGHHQGT